MGEIIIVPRQEMEDAGRLAKDLMRDIRGWLDANGDDGLMAFPTSALTTCRDLAATFERINQTALSGDVITSGKA